MQPQTGHVILLNGTSSSGKSTIAQALQELMDEPYLHSGIDHFLERFPNRIIEYGDGINPARVEGWLAVFRGDTVVEVRIGPLGYQILGGMYRAIAALAHAGINVIVDDVIYDGHVLQLAVEALHTSNVFFVGVRCPLDVAELREQERGNRARGGARAFYELVHRHAVYDLEVDSAALTPGACALRIKQGFEATPSPGAIRQLWERFTVGAQST